MSSFPRCSFWNLQTTQSSWVCLRKEYKISGLGPFCKSLNRGPCENVLWFHLHISQTFLELQNPSSVTEWGGFLGFFFPSEEAEMRSSWKLVGVLERVCSAKRRIFGSCAAVSYSRTLNSFTFDACNAAERQNKPAGKAAAKNWVLSVQRKNIFLGFTCFNRSAANSRIFNKQFFC